MATLHRPAVEAELASEVVGNGGGQQVLKSEKAYIIRLIEADQVKEVAAALKGLDKGWMQEMFKKHSPDDGQEVIDVTWDWFDKMRGFFERAAKNGRPVLFTADQ